MMNIIRSMIGTPPDIYVVITICDFLLLTHPAASTFVNHMTSQFYFMQKWGKCLSQILQIVTLGHTTQCHSATCNNVAICSKA